MNAMQSRLLFLDAYILSGTECPYTGLNNSSSFQSMGQTCQLHRFRKFTPQTKSLPKDSLILQTKLATFSYSSYDTVAD